MTKNKIYISKVMLLSGHIGFVIKNSKDRSGSWIELNTKETIASNEGTWSKLKEKCYVALEENLLRLGVSISNIDLKEIDLEFSDKFKATIFQAMIHKNYFVMNGADLIIPLEPEETFFFFDVLCKDKRYSMNQTREYEK